MRTPPWFRRAEERADRPDAEETAEGQEARREVIRWRRAWGMHKRVLDALGDATAVQVDGHGYWLRECPACKGRHYVLEGDVVELAPDALRVRWRCDWSDEATEHVEILDRHALTHREAVTGVQIGDAGGPVVAVPDARALREDWLADPKRHAGRIAGCCEAWKVSPSDAGWTSSPIRCDDALCPVCVPLRAVAERQQLHEELLGLARKGYTVILLTETRRSVRDDDDAAPVVWTDRDRERWGECPHPTDRLGTAVPGESLGQVWDELLHTRRRVLDGPGFRAWFSRNCAAFVDCIEFTQVREGADGVAVWLRWHGHHHAIMVIPPGVVERDRGDVVTRRRGKRTVEVLGPSCEWWQTWLEALREVHGDISDAAQDAVVLPADPDALRDALREVIKYPGKLSAMTDAGVVEWLATAKGRRPHRDGGAFHGGTRAGRWANVLVQIHVRDHGGEADRCTALAELDRHLEAINNVRRARGGEPLERVEDYERSCKPHERRTARDLADVRIALWEASRTEEAEPGADEAEDLGENRDVLCPPCEALGERFDSGWKLLTYGRLLEYLARGVSTLDGARLDSRDGVELARLDLRRVRREVQRWRPRSREGPGG